LLPLSFVAVTGFLWRSCISEAHAQTVVTFQLLPPGHFGKVQDVGPARYYLLEEYLELAKFDAELVKLRVDILTYQRIDRQRVEQLDAKDQVISTLENDKRVLAGRCERVEGNLETCEKELVKCSGGAIWPYVVGIVGAVIGAVGVGIYIGTR
jgi:hypothetical protein